jgi:hypothetical protein
LVNACNHSVQGFCLLTSSLQVKIYKTIILPFALYGYETWSLAVRECRLRLFQIRVLRRMFGPEREEVAGGWRKLHNELHNLYASPNSIRVIKLRRKRWAVHVAHMGKMGNA